MTRDNGRSRTLAAVLGENCRRIRTKQLKLTQDTLAAYACVVGGLPWNAAKVANFEAGRWNPPFADVLALGMALEHAAKFAGITNPAIRPITLADLLEGSEPVTVRGNTLAGAELASIGRGEPFPTPARIAPPPPALAEQRLARALGIDRARLAEVSQQLWGATFIAERNRRAGAGNQQKRGRVSRELRAELEKALTHDHV